MSLIGPAKTKELIFTGDIIDGDLAKNIGISDSKIQDTFSHHIGIVDHVVEDPYRLSTEIAQKIIRNGN